MNYGSYSDASMGVVWDLPGGTHFAWLSLYEHALYVVEATTQAIESDREAFIPAGHPAWDALSSQIADRKRYQSHSGETLRAILDDAWKWR